MTDISAAEHWLEKHGDVLYRYALVRVRDPAIAEDLLQDTLLAALQAYAQFKHQASEQTWLIGILRHKILDHLRKPDRELPCDSLELEERLAAHYFNEQGGWQQDIKDWSTPESDILQEEFWRVLMYCIDTLPQQQAQLYILREIDGIETHRLCKIFNISSENNLWVRLSRIRMRLRQCLENQWLINIE